MWGGAPGACQTRVVLLRHTPDPDRVCAAAAASCYSASAASAQDAKMDAEKVRRVLASAVRKGHHSVLEHASFTFSLEGVSRAMTHQLVRHRIASYSQQSQRYVRLDRPDFTTPPEVARRPEAKAAFDQAMAGAWTAYNGLVEAGVPEEDARYVLPNAANTNITVTMNARELLHLFALRLCLRAQWEVREVAALMLKEAARVSPAIFAEAGAPCRTGPCPEGAEDCPMYPGEWGPRSD